VYLFGITLRAAASSKNQNVFFVALTIAAGNDSPLLENIFFRIAALFSPLTKNAMFLPG
jgi:hypothetical protein